MLRRQLLKTTDLGPLTTVTQSRSILNYGENGYCGLLSVVCGL